MNDLPIEPLPADTPGVFDEFEAASPEAWARLNQLRLPKMRYRQEDSLEQVDRLAIAIAKIRELEGRLAAMESTLQRKP
jgi:hypothetical protein